MSTVFISYSQKDKKVAAKVRATLEANGIRVTIDSESMAAGGNIRAFIDQAIRDTQVTLSIVSRNSLSSDWVALESIESFAAEKFLEGKKFIACYIDREVFKDEFLENTVNSIQIQIDALNDKISKLGKLVDPVPLQTKMSRKIKMRNNLPHILDRLNNDLTLDIRKAAYETSMQRIIKEIQALLPADSSQAGDKTPPDKSDRSNSTDKVSGNRREAELTYLDQLKEQCFKDKDKYTELGGRSEKQRYEMRNIYERRPDDKIGVASEFGTDSGPRRFEDAVGEILRLKRAVLLGDPGGGKTTTLWKLAFDLLERARKDETAPLPLFIRLGYWTESEQSLMQFIAVTIGELGKHLDNLLGQNRAVLLLDGMNELPAGQRDSKYPQIVNLLKSYQEAICVVSCRELDYPRDLDLRLHQILITPLDPVRIREFAQNYLGDEEGSELFQKLAGEEVLQKLDQFKAAVGSRLNDPEKTFWTDDDLPDGITWGWSYEDNNDNSHWDAWISERDQLASLMTLSRNPFMLKMICEVYERFKSLPTNRGELFKQFVDFLISREMESKKLQLDEVNRLTRSLEETAYEMQIRRLKGENGNALTVLTRKDALVILGERQLYLAESATILSSDSEVRFTHQLLQEYFAACYMKREIAEDRLKADEIWPKSTWWNRTNWEEATKLLAGLYSDDCSPVVEWVAAANPEVAAQCILFSGAKLPEKTKKQLQTDWLSRLSNLKTDRDPRARAAIGRALGVTGWDDRDGVGTEPLLLDGERKINIPKFHWIDIPEGQFRFGENRWKVLPPPKIWQYGFKISCYPVTCAQFQTFLDDEEGCRNSRWFEGLVADANDREIRPTYFQVDGHPYLNHPRDRVNWYQAVAFCRWLSWRLGGEYTLDRIDQWKVRLPTEQEWERAARGTDGRIYPYGNKFDASKANTNETGINQTSAVGIFPHGSSPDGVMDMSGNVWEWCLETVENNHTALAVPEPTTWDTPLRGGSWFSSQDFARAVYRSGGPPDDRRSVFGFRVVSVVRPPS